MPTGDNKETAHFRVYYGWQDLTILKRAFLKHDSAYLIKLMTIYKGTCNYNDVRRLSSDYAASQMTRVVDA